MNGYAYKGKRALDLIALTLLAPIAVPTIAAVSAAVALADGRPVYFTQERAGLNGEPFRIIKFRTMSTSTNLDLSGLSRSAQITKSDSARITRIGRILRKTSLDELPQLVNVLRGEMSLVGPRPLFVRYNPYYTDREARRLSVHPGITGQSQVSNRNNGGWRQRLEQDVRYVENASPWLDLRIIARTLLNAIRSDGVSVIAGETGDALDDERRFPSGNGVSMRRIYHRDLATRVDWLSNPDIKRHMTLPDGISLESTVQWHKAIRENPDRRDYVFETEDGTLVAMSGVKLVRDKNRSEFYVFVNPDTQSRGIGTLATKLTLMECAREKKFNPLWLTVRKENTRAVKIYERLGFQVVEESGDRYGMQLGLTS
ncbi:GNAT family N-acetyltransferase [Dietzia maris]|uniref:GNAT family N-acetyltransferase n=1 Tax=Dietzia maris TaxID=37915 RepID=UPI00232A8537|nr:GNAT family N-acetyltransferase [Dietzia maris]